MAATLHHNVTGEFATELIQVGEGTRIGNVLFCNLHATLACYIDLYIKKQGLGTFYIMKKVKLPAGASLQASGVHFINNSTGFNLYVKLTKSSSETPEVDIIIQ